MRDYCVDCEAEGTPKGRKLTDRNGKHYPGPRCGAHHREVKRERSQVRREQRWEQVYNITAEQYWAIYEAQGGLCAICRRASGKYKFLSVDHDHACCSGKTSCGRCVRSLVCTTCNKMLGHMKDDLEFVERVYLYLLYPPGREVLDEWNAQLMDAKT